MQLKGFRAIKRGLVLVRGPSVPLVGPSVPLTGPQFPLRGPFFNCLIVADLSVTAGAFNCIGPQGASKNVGLGRA